VAPYLGNGERLGNATRVPGYPKTQVNPAVYKPVNPGLRANIKNRVYVFNTLILGVNQ